MILLAHIGMLPFEELVVPLAGVGAGTALWLAALFPRRRKPLH